MIKIFGIKKTTWIAFFVSLVASFIVAGVTNAQSIEQSASENADPEIRAKIYGVTFPIQELGNCSNYYDCRSFCDDPVNSSACIDFGKKKGFYKEEQADIKKKEGILEKAKTELGCDSYESCQSFCQIPTNFEKCDAFAKDQGIAGGHTEDPKNKEIVQKAKELLGCDSYTGCAAFCSDDSNRQKCSDFAKEAGLRGGERPVGPGGCTSEQSCKTLCSDPQNFQVCKGFASSAGGKFQGPGGCDSEDSCRSYCEKNPQSCGPGIGGGPAPVPIKYDPQEMCNRTPACSWKNNTCQCGLYNDEENKKQRDEYSKLCRENPERCTPGGIGGTESREDRADFEKYCRENPEKCRPTYSNYTRGTYDPANECSKYSGCSWTNGTCQCSSRYENVTPSASGAPSQGGTSGGGYTGSGGGGSGGNMMSRDQQEAACRSGGGSCDWSSGVCNCRGYRSSGGTTSNGGGSSGTSGGSYTGTMDPAEGCRKAGGSWTGSYCRMQSSGSGSYPGGSYSGSGGSYSGSGGSYSGSSGSSGGSAPAPAPAPVQNTAPAPQPEQQPAQQQSQPVPQAAPQEPAPAPAAPAPAAPATEPAPAPAVQGISAVRGLINQILDLFR